MSMIPPLRNMRQESHRFELIMDNMRPDHKTTVKRNFKKICFLCPLLHWCCCNERTYGTKKSLKVTHPRYWGLRVFLYL